MIHAAHHFPRRFLWGTATSSHQVEGQNTGNDWWAWEQEPGRILEGGRSGDACGWWAGRWAEDLDRAAEDGQNAHRLSIEWSRIEPKPGVWDRDALDHYVTIIRGALDRGLMPMVTLHHFTNPAWFAESGGWLSESSPGQFDRYVRFVADSLKEFVGLWVTINEPNVYAYNAYSSGDFPPGIEDLNSTRQVLVNLVKAHAAAYRSIHQIQPSAMVGLAHHFRGMRPAHSANPLDRAVAGIRARMFNEGVPRALQDGVLRLPLKRVRLPDAAGTQDFFGLNYYTEESVSFEPSNAGELFSRGAFPAGADLSPTGFIANEPEGFWRALVWVHSFRLPIFITENGVEDAFDGLRPRYLVRHLRQLWRAANFNWQVKGYFHWTLVDNFEWERGWTQRFGLWDLDPDTQTRTRRASADLYAEICRENGLTTEIVGRYAPETLAGMFPSEGPGNLQVEMDI